MKSLQVITLHFKSIFLLLLSIFFISCVSKNDLPNFIDLNDDIRIVKGTKNKNGCTMFTPISKSGKPVPTLIYYIDIHLNISNDSNKPNCL